MLVFFVVIYFLYFLVVPFLVWACFIEFACGDLAINSFFPVCICGWRAKQRVCVLLVSFVGLV